MRRARGLTPQCTDRVVATAPVWYPGNVLAGARIAVIVPAYNEAALIRHTLESIPEFVDQIVLVDDGSVDHTIAAARAVHEARLRIVAHTRNRGVGAAITTGYRRAFVDGADIAAVMAGDAQMDPEDLEPLVRRVLNGGADYAKGDRLSHPDARTTMPTTRWVGNHALSRLTSLCCGVFVRDSQCGYTALSRSAAARLNLTDLWPRYGYPNDLIGQAQQAGLRISEVIVRPIYGSEVSGISPRDALMTIPFILGRALTRRVLGSAGPLTPPDATQSL